MRQHVTKATGRAEFGCECRRHSGRRVIDRRRNVWWPFRGGDQAQQKSLDRVKQSHSCKWIGGPCSAGILLNIRSKEGDRESESPVVSFAGRFLQPCPQKNSASCDRLRLLRLAASVRARRVSAVIRVLNVEILRVNSPLGFRPAPGALFRGILAPALFVIATYAKCHGSTRQIQKMR